MPAHSSRVPREAEPPLVRMHSLFGLQVDAARRYADLLATVAIDRGLLGPQEAQRVWTRHVLNCAVLAPLFSAGATVCDLGSGAGLPGVALALARPDLRLTLVEPTARRADFLQLVSSSLDLPLEVVRARAEELAGLRRFHYVTARAVAPLARLVTLALPLCEPGGELVAIKGASANDEVASAEAVVRRLGASKPKIEHLGTGVVAPETLVVRIHSPRR